MDVMGVEVGDISEGFTPTEVILLVKGLESDGVVRVYRRTSSGLSQWESLGMLNMMLLQAQQECLDSWEGED